MAKVINSKQNIKHYDLEERTYLFAKNCRDFVNKLPKTLANLEYGKQLIRASGSQASNYIEANEALSKRDFAHRIKICRKETKESGLWLKLVEINKNGVLDKERSGLISESIELRKIFSSILIKSG
ncbi:MAG: four helix bundle protein [Patescibacteria group bacterium]|nr:four helix bundle protein [Patescibacteria group bacterium]